MLYQLSYTPMLGVGVEFTGKRIAAKAALIPSLILDLIASRIG